ncbi:MAG TPA: isoamylase early set domain-containing protein [Longimicrobiales bacterium]
MHPDLHRFLDGELPLAALPPELRAEAEEWQALLDAAAALGEERAPASLEHRVMAAVARMAPPLPAWRRLLRWLVAPRTVQVRPAGLLVAAAAAAALILVAWPESRPPLPATGAPGSAAVTASAEPAVVLVQFVYHGGAARSVAIAGDFNGWDPAHHGLRDPDGDGIWTAVFPVPVGLHKYMFVVDGERWVTDPNAERYIDDGFGMRNALLSVTPPPAPRRAS